MTTEQLSIRLSTMFADLNFEDQRHLYYVNGDPFPSVSSKVEGHAVKFNAEKVLPWSAKKLGTTVDELRAQWINTNKTACDLGHETHDFLEGFNGLQTAASPFQKAGVQFLLDILVDYEIVHRELRMYSREFRYAGTTDLILRSKKTGNIVIADYKTNKDLFKTWGFLKPPFGYLECHPFNKYQLQLSYYQIPIEEGLKGCDITVEERKIVYLLADGSYKLYDTYDFTAELRKHLSQPPIKEKKNEYLW